MIVECVHLTQMDSSKTMRVCVCGEMWAAKDFSEYKSKHIRVRKPLKHITEPVELCFIWPVCDFESRTFSAHISRVRGIVFASEPRKVFVEMRCATWMVTTRCDLTQSARR